MPKTGFVHRVDAFAFVNRWDMQPGDWDQLRGLIQGAATAVALHPLVLPLALIVPGGPPAVGFVIGQIMNNVNPGPIGLCGGMTFAAADYYGLSWLPPRGEFASGPNPRNPGWSGPEETTLRRYIWNRLLDSLRGNVAVKTLIWMVARNISSPIFNGPQWVRDRSRDELPLIKASIDRGQPCPIGLVGTTPNPLSNHQVLVTGYDDPGPLGASSVRLYVYEPNGPNVEQTIDFDFSGGGAASESVSPGERGPLQGFFAAMYAPQQPPPALVMSAGLEAAPALRVNVGEAEQFTMTVKNQGFGDTPLLKLYVAGRAGAANVDPGGEAAAARIPMNGARTLLQRTTIAAPLGLRNFFASSSVEPDSSHQAWRLPAAVGTGNTFTELTVNDSVRLAQGAKRVAYRTVDGHIHELSVALGGSWSHADLSSLAGAPPAPRAPGGFMRAFACEAMRSKQVAYLTGDGHVHELSVAVGGGWSHADLTVIARSPIATPAGFISTFAVGAMNSQQVVYLTADGHIHELSIGLSSGWSHADLSNLTRAPAAIPGSFISSFAVEAMRSKQVIYLTPDGHIHELSVAVGGGWSHADLTVIAGAPAAAPSGFFSGFAVEAMRSKQVVYLTADGHIHELSVAVGGGWSHADLTVIAGAPAAAPGGFLSGFAVEAMRSKQVVYLTPDGHIHELSVAVGGGWSHADLTVIAGAPAATPGGFLSGFAVEAMRSKQVVYRTTDGHIHELSVAVGGGWSHADLTAIAGAPAAV